jgi:1-aminocyclopropane-1-carboxylate deaminase/D-cysteine desulfhydrase-like pyridoxal-dependent ACC family enzyme
MIKKNIIYWMQNNSHLTYPRHSRVHPLNNFPPYKERRWFIKRDDELSFGISGSKYRKYASLIHYLIQEKINHVLLVGSAYSNHLVGLLQLLNESKIKATLYLSKTHDQILQGNRALIKLLIGNNLVHTLSKEQWINKDTLIPLHLDSASLYIPEGADMLPSLPGALSLAQDIARNQLENGCNFDHIFIDAGTGLSAIGLLLGMPFFNLKAHVHIVLMAGTAEKFHEKLLGYQDYLEGILQTSIHLPAFSLYNASIGKAFGSTPEVIFTEIDKLATEEGILTDPIYSAKLFYSAKDIANETLLEGNILCIHSGGGLTLSGFLDRL